ncbi:two-component regulator propeller domain-containing protein [Marinicella sp. W31]|uniref:hybrid sensor histidine kinase/response regulator transcription factor n=1 Tax=Marinicella sp. W31 TaxID=3023713 RepID=UPI0037578A16
MSSQGFFRQLLYFTLLCVCFITQTQASNLVRFNQVGLATDNTSIQIVRGIQQDPQGFIWIATGYQGLYRYDGYQLKPIDLDQASPRLIIKTLEIDNSGTIWVGTEHNGLYGYSPGQTEHFTHIQGITTNHVSALLADNTGLWVATSGGLDYLSTDREVINYLNVQQDTPFSRINTLLSRKESLLLGTDTGLFEFFPQHMQLQRITIANNLESISINALYQETDGAFWVGTDSGLYLQEKPGTDFHPYQDEYISGRVFSIIGNAEYIWIGTLFNGLYSLNKATTTLENHRYSSNRNDTISDNNVLSMMVDRHGLLWLGTFNSGVNTVDFLTTRFGLHDDSANSVYCATTKVFYHFHKDDQDNLWIASEDGLIAYNAQQRHCQHYGSISESKNTFSHPLIYHINSIDENTLWVATARGLNLFNKKNGSVDRLTDQVPATNTYFTIEKGSELLLGTNQGLFRYSITNQTSQPINAPEITNSNFHIYDVAIDQSGHHYFATNQGVYKLNTAGDLAVQQEIQNQLPPAQIMSLHIDEQDHMWVGTFLYGLFHFNNNGTLITAYDATHGLADNTSINSILQSPDKDLWMGSDKGLIRLHKDSDTIHIFHQNDGLQSDFFIKASVYQSASGQVYMGGRKGFNVFDPTHIKLNQQPPLVAITEFNRMRKTHDAGAVKHENLLSQALHSTDQLTLSHQDYMMGFEFAVLDFADSSRNQYAYMLEGLDPDWNLTDAHNRTANYTNLNSGHYTFKVKGANKNGIWSDNITTIQIEIPTPVWMRWWAISLYVLAASFLLYGYTQRKNKASQRLNLLLRQEVEKRTRELELQKKKVENLLSRKNDFFTHISHEFRTPLTLILGPINRLLKMNVPGNDVHTLQTVNRNANRLLTLIEQLLQMAKVSDQQSVAFQTQNIQGQLQGIVDSFQSLAEDKRITLQLIHNPQAIVKVTEDAIDTVIGNLLSNAIKYTPIGGQVTVDSSIQNNQVCIQVADSGCGLSPAQQSEIFERFKRLDSHRDIEGTGIGLSIVKEVMRANKGSIDLSSALGHGSIFTVKFPMVPALDDTATNSSLHPLIQQLSQNLPQNNAQVKTVTKHHRETVLIVDDNPDMRTYIAQCLESHYRCLLAEEGKSGVMTAIQQVPDVIVCDVMMPGMDGFEVSRLLRSDTRTSHIPLILLTALSDKENRIKGWREHVDAYLTKPFCSDELKAQLESVLVIRNILRNKAGQQISTDNKNMALELPKKDQQFINKLMKLIDKNYSKSHYMRAQMAQDMAVSERQLQRKLKALIDKNPTDLLREYRLKQAARLLKEGYQVNQIADRCGFGSPTYFSKCFKAQYGMPPKQYQDACNKTTQNI